MISSNPPEALKESTPGRNGKPGLSPQVVGTDITPPMPGLSHEALEALAGDVTHIVHNAWWARYRLRIGSRRVARLG